MNGYQLEDMEQDSEAQKAPLEVRIYAVLPEANKVINLAYDKMVQKAADTAILLAKQQQQELDEQPNTQRGVSPEAKLLMDKRRLVAEAYNYANQYDPGEPGVNVPQIDLETARQAVFAATQQDSSPHILRNEPPRQLNDQQVLISTSEDNVIKADFSSRRVNNKEFPLPQGQSSYEKQQLAA